MLLWRFYRRNLFSEYLWIEFPDFLASQQDKTHTPSKAILVELVYFHLGSKKKKKPVVILTLLLMQC